MTSKARLDGFERRLKAIQTALERQGRMRRPLLIVDDPEEGLEEFRLYGVPQEVTVEIAEAAFEALRERYPPRIRE